MTSGTGSTLRILGDFEKWLLKPDFHSWWILKMQSGREDTWEERYTLKICFKLGKSATETYGMLQTAFRPSFINRVSDFEWHKRFKEGTDPMRDYERCGRSKEVNTPQLIDQRIRFVWGLLCWGFKGFQQEIPSEEASTLQIGQGHLHQDNKLVHNSILVIDYLTKMGIKTVPQPPNSPDLAPSDFWFFPKLRGCCYETIEEMKEAVARVIDTLTQEDFHGAFQKLLEQYNKCIAAGGDYFKGDYQ